MPRFDTYIQRTDEFTVASPLPVDGAELEKMQSCIRNKWIEVHGLGQVPDTAYHTHSDGEILFMSFRLNGTSIPEGNYEGIYEGIVKPEKA
jgi:hypothetical protein